MRIASYTTTPRLSQDAFHSQLENAGATPPLSASKPATLNPQTLTEKIVQRYSVGLAPGKKVKAGDYVTLKVQFHAPEPKPQGCTQNTAEKN